MGAGGICGRLAKKDNEKLSGSQGCWTSGMVVVLMMAQVRSSKRSCQKQGSGWGWAGLSEASQLPTSPYPNKT